MTGSEDKYLTVAKHNLYVLCELLHMPAYKLLAEMPQSEYRDWQLYLQKSRSGEEPVFKSSSESLIDIVKSF